MDLRHVLVVDGVRIIHRLLFERYPGVAFHLLVSKKDARPEDLALPWHSITYLPLEASRQEWVGVAEGLHRNYPFERLVCFHDVYQLTTIAIAQCLELPFYIPAVAVQQSRCKLTMRQVLHQAGLVQPAFARLENSADLLAFFKRNHHGIVVKPLAGTASEHVCLISGEAQALVIGEELSAQALYPLLGEALVVGKEYSIEAFSVQGKHYILGVVEKRLFPESTVEMGHIFPAPLVDSQQQAIAEYVAKVLDVLTITAGPSHTEIILEPCGEIKVIETHTRPGGDQIWRLIAEVSQVNIMELCAEFALAREYYLPAGAFAACAPASYAAIHFVHYQEGTRFAGIANSEAVSCRSDGAVIVEVENLLGVGEQIPPLRHSFDRLAYAICRADSSEQAWVSAGRAVQPGS